MQFFNEHRLSAATADGDGRKARANEREGIDGTFSDGETVCKEVGFVEDLNGSLAIEDETFRLIVGVDASCGVILIAVRNDESLMNGIEADVELTKSIEIIVSKAALFEIISAWCFVEVSESELNVTFDGVKVDFFIASRMLARGSRRRCGGAGKFDSAWRKAFELSNDIDDVGGDAATEAVNGLPVRQKAHAGVSVRGMKDAMHVFAGIKAVGDEIIAESKLGGVESGSVLDIRGVFWHNSITYF